MKILLNGIGVFFIVALLAVIAAAWFLPHPRAATNQTLQVVAAENFWGSLAAQLGGSDVHVTSILSDPNTDPHEYESSTADARVFAAANYVILNGAGYDDWGDKLLAANPQTGRKVLTVSDLLNQQVGDNPHFWYNPTYVYQVIDQITADYEALDPAHKAYYQAQHQVVENALQPYADRLNYLKLHDSGVKVAATEDIFSYLANYTGLTLISPAAFMQAVAEGNDPPVQSVVTFNQQLDAKLPKVLVYNLQTSTAVTTNLKTLAANEHIPVIGVTETMQPPTATFESWMDAQLDALTQALNEPAS